MQESVEKVYVSEGILDYVIALFQLTRDGEYSVNPLSPRAGKALIAASKAWAFIENRDHVLPDDIKAVFEAVCEHRLTGSHQQNRQEYKQKGNQFSQQVLARINSADPFEQLRQK